MVYNFHQTLLFIKKNTRPKEYYKAYSLVNFLQVVIIPRFSIIDSFIKSFFTIEMFYKVNNKKRIPQKRTVKYSLHTIDQGLDFNHQKLCPKPFIHKDGRRQ